MKKKEMISLFLNIPNLVVFSPSSKEELVSMIDYSLDQKERPIVILVPRNEVASRREIRNVSEINKYEVTQKGSKVAIFALGDFYQRGEKLAKKIKERFGFVPTLINPRFASIDEETLTSLLDHKLILTLEDEILDGGFGQKIAFYFGDKNIYVKNYGLKKEFIDRYDPKQLLKNLGMDENSILEDIKKIFSLN